MRVEGVPLERGGEESCGDRRYQDPQHLFGKRLQIPVQGYLAHKNASGFRGGVRGLGLGTRVWRHLQRGVHGLGVGQGCRPQRVKDSGGWWLGFRVQGLGCRGRVE